MSWNYILVIGFMIWCAYLLEKDNKKKKEREDKGEW